VLFFLFITPVFLCGSALVFYLVFPPAPMDILILGLDARSGEGFAARTDSVILLGVDPGRVRVSMLSIPRDLFIDVPGYGLQRINTVNLLGEQAQVGSGPELVSSGIEQDFGIQIDRYVRLNFEGFVDLVNAVGGITVEVERAIVDNAYPLPDGGTTSVRFDPGTQVMDGERALIYARTRHGDDDYARANRQQQLILALSRELINPINLPGALAVITRSVDTDLNIIDMTSLTPTILLNAGRFDALVIDRNWITSRDQVSVPDFAVLQPWIVERFD
jgi:LCP family protein required for cell wall assembly